MNDCYLHEQNGNLLFGNSKIEIKIDGENGCIKGLLNKEQNIEFIKNSVPEVFRIVYCVWSIHGAAIKDPWSAVHGTTINSNTQKLYTHSLTKSEDGAKLEIKYNQLRLERRTINVNVKYTVDLKSGKHETKWKIYIENNDEGTIRDINFPFISGLKKFDSLIMPDSSGQKLTNPIDKLSDEVPIIHVEYPGRGSMQWFEYYSSITGLYMASYDKSLEYTTLSFGRVKGPEDTKNVAMWISKYPFVTSTTIWESPIFSIGIHSGDWHWGADRYREWLETWTEKPKISKYVKEMIWLRGVCIKNMKEELESTYEDVVREARETQASSHVIMFMLVGWFYNGHDTFYPEYKPIPDLGGENALIKAVDNLHSLNVTVSAYINGRIANIETETYKKYGKKWAILGKAPDLGVNTIDFFELHENWNQEWTRSGKSEGWFVVMCPSVKEWQNHMVFQSTRIFKDYHIDGLFIDQPGSYYAEFCYNKNHGHRTPANAWGPGLLQMFHKIREETRKINPESFLYTEGMNDAYGQYLDFHYDKNPLSWANMSIHPERETFAEMWRYTLPSYVTSGEGYTYPPSQDKIYGINYFFVMGLRLRGFGPSKRKPDLTDEEWTKAKAVMEKIEQLWKKGKEFFFYGRFMDDIGLYTSNPDVFSKVYTSRKGAEIVMWNTTKKDAICDVSVNLKALGITDVKVTKVMSLNKEKNIPYKRKGDVLKTKIKINAHDVDAITIRIERQNKLY